MITFEYPELKSTATHLKQVTAEEHFRQQCAARDDAIRRENSLKYGMEAANQNRVGGGHEAADLSHHRAYRSVHGGSTNLTSDTPFGVVVNHRD